MQEYIELVVLEEHQSKVVVDPSLTSQQVHLCIILFVRLCIAFSDLVLDIGIYIFMHLDSEQVVLEEHPIGVIVSEVPQPTITYSHTVSKNVILVWNLKKCT